jgi:large subunit ribosomal protein L2
VTLCSSLFNTKKYKQYSYLSNFLTIKNYFFLIHQLPKYKPVCALELYPTKGVQYCSSSGSTAVITKIDNRSSLALIRLPSGVQKIFSSYSVGSSDRIPFFNKSLKNPAKAGFKVSIGKKPLSRGVAKNPVDHPHGGRNKAIRYQRTP